MKDKKEEPAEERGLVCLFCGEGFGYAGQTPDEATLKAACDHEALCPRNPYKAQVETLREAGRRLLAYIDDDEISPEDSAKLLGEMESIFANSVQDRSDRPAAQGENKTA